MSDPESPLYTFDFNLEDASDWLRENGLNAESLSQESAAMLWAHLKPLFEKPVLVGLSIVDDEMIQELNASYRHKNKPTNVLSFPTGDDPSDAVLPYKHIGDIIISYETLAREADVQEKELKDHFQHLVVHSLLHLMGYDHVDGDEAEEMEAIEVAVLTSMGIDDPYLIEDDNS